MTPQTRRSLIGLRLLSAGVVVLLLAIFAVVWISNSNEAEQKPSPSLKDAAREFIADPHQFVSNRFSGGIGAALSMDASGFVRINGVIQGTPAEASGLKADDLILEVDGQSTQGMTLVQTVESIRGFTLTKVDLLIRRDGTNLLLNIDRASWQKLRQQGNFQ